MSDTLTPRTDAVETTVKFPSSAEYYELIRFTRNLELELAESTIDLRHMADIAEAMTSERDKLVTALGKWQPELCEETERENKRLKAELAEAKNHAL